MKNPDLVKPTCTECGQQFSSKEAETHFHVVNTVSDDPLVYLLMLPPNCPAGSVQAARVFGEAMVEVVKKSPNKNIRLAPFSFVPIKDQSGNTLGSGIDSMVAVVE